MKIQAVKFYFAITLLLFYSASNAQKVNKENELKIGSLVHIETIDGNDYIGTLISKDSNSMLVKTKNLGEVSFKIADIKTIEITQPEQIRKGEYWYENPNASRYLFAPSAFNLRKGQGYYQNTLLFMNQVSYGFTNHFSCGLGLVPLFLFGGGEYSPMWVTPKYMFGKGDKKFNFSTGVIAFFIPFGGSETNGSVGIAYGLGTYGNRDNNLSVGLGWGFARSNGDGAFGRRPTINLSGMLRISKNSYLVTENWFTAFGDDEFISNFSVISGAYRYTGKHISVDLGLLKPYFFGEGDEELFFIPWLGVTLPFGKKYKL